MELDELLTEARNHRSQGLDRRSTRELVELMNEEDATVPAAVAAAADGIASAIDAIVERLAAGGRLIYVGAGTSGRLAALDAAECGPTFSTAPGQVVALVAGGASASNTVLQGSRIDLEQEAAEDDAKAGALDVRGVGVSQRDAVVAVSASGRTPYTLGAAEAAASAGAMTVAVVCVEGSPLGRVADREIAVVVGPELLAGSTRLKAGTAQKLVLNMLSTISMVRLGKAFDNLMVDVAASNEKLRGRARRV